MKILSVIIPAYNEAAYIGKLLQQVLAVQTEKVGFRKEIIVVDDGSTDATSAKAEGFEGVRVIRQVPNRGKGRSVQRGVREAIGDYVLVQDSDLEYDPQDFLPMLMALDEEGTTAVYGSRTMWALRHSGFSLTPGRSPGQAIGPWLANLLLTLVTFVLYGRWISDMLTGYKVYPTRLLQGFNIRTHGFETDHEISAKLIRAGVHIKEVPVRYYPRSIEEGKKIRMRDGLIAVYTLLRYRFAD